MKNGLVLTIAWPETRCKQAGAWYDASMIFLGFSKNHYYKVGHAAIVLIDGDNGACHYFDFGRYHAPLWHGRARSAVTDHDLKMNTIVQISNGKILNINELLVELQSNPAFRGTGKIYTAYYPIDFDKGMEKAHFMQKNSPWKYGPFVWHGSNCSRLVRTIAMAGVQNWWRKFRLFFPLTISPTTYHNVYALPNQRTMEALRPLTLPTSDVGFIKRNLKSTLPEPVRPESLPIEAKWLAGEAGSWFFIQKEKENYRIIRYSPQAVVECNSLFEIKNEAKIDLSETYEFIHLSHCQCVNIEQNGKKIVLEAIQ
jgi:hypothetical protein